VRRERARLGASERDEDGGEELAVEMRGSKRKQLTWKGRPPRAQEELEQQIRPMTDGEPLYLLELLCESAQQVYPQPSTHHPQPSTLNPQPSTLNHTLYVRRPTRGSSMGFRPSPSAVTNKSLNHRPGVSLGEASRAVAWDFSEESSGTSLQFRWCIE